MKKKRTYLSGIAAIAFLLGALLLLGACTTDPNDEPGPPPVVEDVTILFNNQAVPNDGIRADKGAPLQFKVQVTGQNNPPQTVTWAVVGSNQSTINNTGLLSIAMGEADNATFTVAATSTVDETKRTSVRVRVNPKSTVTDITVTTTAEVMETGGTLQFSVEVTGANDPSPVVIWSITSTGANAGTTISETGLLTVASAETLTSITVRATSTVADFTDKFDEKTVRVVAAGAPYIKSITISGASAVIPGGTGQFTATVEVGNNATTDVTWSITGTGYQAGTTISAAGLLTVAEGEPNGKSITVRATSNQSGFTDKYEEVNVTVMSATANLALGRGDFAVASSNSSYNSNANEKNPFDGVRYTGTGTTHWQAAGADGVAAWLAVDLGAVYNLGGVIVVWHPGDRVWDGMTSAVIQVAETRPSTMVAGNYEDDGWTNVGTITNKSREESTNAITDNGWINIVELDPGTSGRYIRVKMTDPLTNPPAWTMWTRISSFEVYQKLPEE